MALSREREREGGRDRVLVLRALGLGDLLTGVPSLRALRRALPEHEIVLAAPRALLPLVELAEVADLLLDAVGLEPLAGLGPPPQLAVNLHGKGPQSHRLLKELRPAELVAFGCPEAGHPGRAWRADEHEASRWCRLLEETLGIPTDPTDLGLTVPLEEPPAPGAVVVHPGAAYPSRRWPVARFAAVARWAAARGHEVVVTGGAEERELADAVRRGAGLAPEAVLAGRTALGQLAAQIASASLLISGDTGVAHLATAYATPSVLLFGPTAPERWGPPSGGPHTVLWHGDGSGDPWSQQLDPALDRITVAEVLEAVEAGLSLSRSRPEDLRSGRTTPASA
jgi:ADP-heptose:LPS heptosyltransferase